MPTPHRKEVQLPSLYREYRINIKPSLARVGNDFKPAWKWEANRVGKDPASRHLCRQLFDEAHSIRMFECIENAKAAIDREHEEAERQKKREQRVQS